MQYNLVGIDTIRFSVSQRGFKEWLGKQGFSKVKVSATPLTSRTLMKRVEREPSLRVIKINDSYGNKLSNYITVTEHATKKGRHYLIDIAGLHQPTNGAVNIGTYRVLKKLLERYKVHEIDLAYDFIAKNSEVTQDKTVIAQMLGSQIAGTSFTSTYFAIGATSTDYELASSIWSKDAVLYWKHSKEQQGNPLWYRLELKIDDDVAIFRDVQTQKLKQVNMNFLENIAEYINNTAVRTVLDYLSETSTSYEYLDEQLRLLRDGRALRHYKG